MATVKEIQAYVKESYGFVPKSCWIADVKEQNGLAVRMAWNRQDITKRMNPCPTGKQAAIKDALAHFKMI